MPPGNTLVITALHNLHNLNIQNIFIIEFERFDRFRPIQHIALKFNQNVFLRCNYTFRPVDIQ